jgi:hypothetical protein
LRRHTAARQPKVMSLLSPTRLLTIETEGVISETPESAPEETQGFAGRRFAVLVEWGFGAAIVVAIILLVKNVLVDGYLPDPFLHAKSDTFMDWYNPAYWANNQGTYSIWQSIYPPFCFVILRLFSSRECYAYSVDVERQCDPTGIVLITVFTLVNFVLVWRVFRKVDRLTAPPRAIAVGLGFPVLYAWERGNLLVLCFTAFILAYGNLLKSARLKALCAAISLNFKPYLILALAGRFIKRDWIWLEWCGLCFIAIYAASFAIFGGGDPMTLIRNTLEFQHSPGLDVAGFSTTYNAVLAVTTLPLPIVEMLGSAPVEAIERYVPLLIYSGAVGVIGCLAYATWRPTICTRARISLLALVLFMSFSTAPGGYSLEYALLLLFFDKWSGPCRIIAMICAYLWCIPFDVPVTNLYNDAGFSFLSQRFVQYDTPITIGELTRPGLLLLMEYSLVVTTAGSVYRDLRNLRNHRMAAALS